MRIVTAISLIIIAGLLAVIMVMLSGDSDEPFDVGPGLPHGNIKILKIIELDLVSPKNQPIPSNSYLEILCIDGYQYVHLGRHPISGITQMFRWDEDLERTVPIRCDHYTPLNIHQDRPEDAGSAVVSP